MAGSPGFRTWVALLALLHLALALLLWEPAMFEGGDNATYMILGEALREGRGYRDLHLPGEPWHAKYPPLYPALLAAVGWVGGLQLLKLLSLAFTTGAVALTAWLGRRLAGPAAGLAAAGLLAVNPVLLEYAHWVLSEAPFVFLILLALALLSIDSERAHALGVAAAVAAFLTRTAGMPLLLAAVAVPALGRRRRRATVAGAAGLLSAGGWGLYQMAAAPGRPGYLAELALRNPYDPGAGRVGAGDLLERIASNVWSYASEVLPGSLTGAGTSPDGAGVPLAVLGLLLSALVLAGWIGRAVRRLGYAELFTLLYAGLLAAWPSVWTDRRFLLPVLPLLLLYGAAGAVGGTRRLVRRWEEGGGGARVEGRWARRAVPAAAAGFGALLAVPALADGIGRIPDRVACVASYRAGEPCHPPALASFYDAARWAGRNTDPDAVIANRKPGLFYWESRRRGDVYRFSAEPALVVRGLEEMGATHVVVDAVSATTPLYLVPAIRRFRDRFELVYAEGEPPTAILRFRGAPAAALGAP